MQLSFFSNNVNQEARLSTISGLQYIENYITPDEEKELQDLINEEVWLNDLNRRVQHYGYKYDYKKRKIDKSMKIGALPTWASNIGKRLYQDKYMNDIPDQVIVNEYLAGQGIADHIDCEPCFTDTIVSLSLGSCVNMTFININDDAHAIGEKFDIALMPRSIITLQKNARYNWTHGIKPTKTFKLNGQSFLRGTRISLTFRKVIESEIM